MSLLTNEKIVKEINASGLSEMDREILLWYLSLCKTANQWTAFAGCSFKRTGPYSYQSNRMWYVPDRLLKLSRGVDKNTA